MINYKALWCFGVLVSLMGLVGIASVSPRLGLILGLAWLAVVSFTGFGILRHKKDEKD